MTEIDQKMRIRPAARFARHVLCALAVPLALLTSGCLQIDTRVKVNEDGSATITEKVRFSRRLLDLGREGGIAELLKKEAALARMKSMGTGLALKSHKIQDAEGGSRESVAVFTIPDLNQFQYVSPWPAYKDFGTNNVVKCQLGPRFKSKPYRNGKAGEIIVTFRHTKRAVGHARHKKGDPLPKGPTPQELQVYREIGPVFRDVLKGFKVRLTLESYAPISRSGYGVRNHKSGAKELDLINFSDKDLDRFGQRFLENEELMLDLVRLELGSADIVNHVKQYVGNHTLPVFFPAGSSFMWWTGGTEICFRPSKTLFDKYYAGKMLDFSQWGKSDPKNQVKATWARIGYHPPKTKK